MSQTICTDSLPNAKSRLLETVQRGKVEAGPFQPGFVFSCHASQGRINRIDRCLYFKIQVGTLNHLEFNFWIIK